MQGTPGAALHPDLAVDRAFLILRKGMHAGIDSYSAFVEADGRTTTGLAALLKARGVKRVFACGLATDYCVAHSALDARADGFATFVIEDACRAIDANNSLSEAWAKMNAAEVWRIQSAEILGSSRTANLRQALTAPNIRRARRVALERSNQRKGPCPLTASDRRRPAVNRELTRREASDEVRRAAPSPALGLRLLSSGSE